MRVIWGHDAEVADWAGAALGVKFQPPFTAFGILDASGRLCGASVFNDFYPGGNIEWTFVGARSLRRGIIREIVEYVFIKNRATRMTAKTRRGNSAVRRLLPKAGFAYEGTQKCYFGPDRADDALVFALFRADAERWLR